MNSDALHLRRAIALSLEARGRGNRPFGALIADDAGAVLAEAENNSQSSGDCTGHAETNALRRLAGLKVSRDAMARCTMYASGEPCVMCAGAIFWSNIRRVVYGVDHLTLRRLRGSRDDQIEFGLTIRDVLRASPHTIEVVGPTLEAEAIVPHQGFWKE